MRRTLAVKLLNWSISRTAPYIERFRTSNLLSDLVALTGPAQIIFDVGANVGQSTASFSLLFPSATIIAFEPLPSACAAIRSRNLPRVRVVEAAVGDSPGKAVLHLHADSQTNSLLAPTPVGRSVFGQMLKSQGESQVTVITVDGYCTREGIATIDLLKIDTQGTELAVLRGAIDTISRVRVIQVEANFVPQYEGSTTFGEVDTFLRDRGFELYNLYQLWRDGASGRLIFGNCVYVNRQSKVL